MHPHPRPTVSNCIWFVNILASTSFQIPIFYNYHHLWRFREKAGRDKCSKIQDTAPSFADFKFFVNVIFGCRYTSQTSVLFLMVRWFSIHHTVCDVSTTGLSWNTLYGTCQQVILHETHCMRRVNTSFTKKHTVSDVPTPYLAWHCTRRVSTWFSMRQTVCDVPIPDLSWNTLYATCQHLI